MTTTFEPHQPDVLVVRLDGTEDERDIATAVGEIRASTAKVVLDVSALVLSNVPALRRICATLDESAVGLVCSRLSGRRLLARVAGPGMRVFPTADDALAALTADDIAAPPSNPWNSEGPG